MFDAGLAMRWPYEPPPVSSVVEPTFALMLMTLAVFVAVPARRNSGSKPIVTRALKRFGRDPGDRRGTRSPASTGAADEFGCR